MIKAILFDVGEVTHRGLKGTEKLISEKLGREIRNRDLHTPELLSFFHGKISEEKMWQSLIERFGWQIDVSTLKDMVRSNFGEVPGTREIVVELYSRNYRLGILSVHGNEWVEYLEQKYRFQHLFHHIEFSCHRSVCKPDEQSFAHALTGLNVKAENCLFVDDHSINIEAADKLGFVTRKFTGAEQLRKDLEELRLL